MALLKILDGPEAGRTLPLKPGPNKIGRAADNDLVLNDLSISSRHGELLFSANSAVIRDLGSTNGTFLQDKPVTEAALHPGQSLKLGAVTLRFETDASPVRISHAALPQPPVPAPIPGVIPQPHLSAAELADECPQHPGTPATLLCQKCGQQSCAGCARAQIVAGKTLYFCSCGGRCDNLQEARQKARVRSLPKPSFARAALGSWKYPFRGNGLLLLGCGTIFFGIMDFISAFGILSLFLLALGYGYLYAYMQKIIRSTADGEDSLPTWPEVSEFWSDMLQPFLHLVVTLFLTIGPGIFLLGYSPLLGMFALCLGLFYLPMGLLAVAMSDSLSALNPLIIISSIVKVPGAYLIACLNLVLIVILESKGQAWLELLPIPLLPALLTGFLSLLVLTVQMRILGLLYYFNKERLGWYR